MLNLWSYPVTEPNHHLSPHYNPKSISCEQPRGFPKQSDLLLASFATMVSSSDNRFVLAETKWSVRYPPYSLKAGYAVPSTRAFWPLNHKAVAPSNRFHPVSYRSKPPQTIRFESGHMKHKNRSPRKWGRISHAIAKRPKALTPSTNPRLGVESKHQELHRCALQRIFRPVLGASSSD